MGLYKFMFFSLVVNLEKAIQFDNFLLDNNYSIGKYGIYDRYLYQSGGVMGFNDIWYSVEYWESMGLKSFIKINGNIEWKDLCVIPVGDNDIQPKWLRYNFENQIVKHVADSSQLIVGPNPYSINERGFPCVKGKYISGYKVIKGAVSLDKSPYAYNIYPNGDFLFPITDETVEKVNSDNCKHTLHIHDFNKRSIINKEFELNEENIWLGEIK